MRVAVGFQREVAFLFEYSACREVAETLDGSDKDALRLALALHILPATFLQVPAETTASKERKVGLCTFVGIPRTLKNQTFRGLLSLRASLGGN